MADNILDNDIMNLLPPRGVSQDMELSLERDRQLKKGRDREKSRINASEMVRLKLREKERIRQEEVKQSRRDTVNDREAAELERRKETLRTIETIDANQPVVVLPKEAAALQGTSRPDVVKLLTALNINLNLQLTKNDVKNLIACLMTCNATQLDAVFSNAKTPVVIKGLIKRIIDDARVGNIETTERLWDRIFGKADMVLDVPQGSSLIEKGILPNTPVSRETYVLIRETIMGRDDVK